MRNILTTSKGLDKELCELLRAKLGIPEHVQSFSVRLSVDEAVTVDCIYFPTEPTTLEDMPSSVLREER